MRTSDVQELIAAHALEPHPEGGWYRRTYEAPMCVPGTDRSVSTAILYLLSAGERSALHRIDADELWHFYDGDPLTIVELSSEGPARCTELSRSNPQHLVPAGVWFGAMPSPGSAFALVGCTVSPGFQFSGFELGDRAALLAEFPGDRELIEQLTP